MKEFLSLKSPTAAKEILWEYLMDYLPEKETIKTSDGFGRILAVDLYSQESIPAFKRSTVDGYAVKSKDTFGASEPLPIFLRVVGEVEMGKETVLTLNEGDAALIHTGGMVPETADAVIMVEYTEITHDHEISCMKAVAPNENIIKKGEDVLEGNLIFTSGTELRPGDIGGLMALGITEIEVFKSPVIGIVSTGDELISPDQQINLGQIRDINSYTLKSLVEKLGGIPKLYGIVPDNYELLEKTLRNAHQETDMVIVTAGSSASVRDLTATVVESLGKPGVLVHGVNIRPGKPTILAVCNGKPVIGLPGNPVSAYVIANIFVSPIIQKLRGLNPVEITNSMIALSTVNISSVSGREDWVPVKILEQDEHNKFIVEPIFYKSNLVFSMIKADGLIKIPENANGLPANTKTELILL